MVDSKGRLLLRIGERAAPVQGCRVVNFDNLFLLAGCDLCPVRAEGDYVQFPIGLPAFAEEISGCRVPNGQKPDKWNVVRIARVIMAVWTTGQLIQHRCRHDVSLWRKIYAAGGTSG